MKIHSKQLNQLWAESRILSEADWGLADRQMISQVVLHWKALESIGKQWNALESNGKHWKVFESNQPGAVN